MRIFNIGVREVILLLVIMVNWLLHRLTKGRFSI